jgi:hypothetical protein
MLLRHALRAAGPLGALAVLSQAGCFYSDQGLSPPHQSFYFPTGLAVSPGRNALYVANSDFDLQFNGGTVQVLDLRRMRGSLDGMLARVRCNLGAADACAGLANPPTSVRDACNGVPFRDVGSGLAEGKACNQAVDCASGVCLDGTDLAAGTCAKCVIDGDCNAGGRCVSGACFLEENVNTALSPSPCTPIAPPLAGAGKAFATIGAFASGAVIAEAPDRQCVTAMTACSTDDDCPVGDPCQKLGGVRLFVPVRGDPSITWFDVVDDRGPFTTQAEVDAVDVAKLACGGQGDDHRCFQDNQIGLDPYENARSLTLPVEPSGLDVSEDGHAIVTAHQIPTGPAVGLSTNLWPERPSFQFYLGSNVGSGPIEVAHVPVPRLVTLGQRRSSGIAPLNYQPGFLVTYNASAEVDLFRFNDDALSSPRRPFLTRASQAFVSVNADGKDSRGVVVDPSKRRTCEAGCAQDASGVGCLRLCLNTPLDLFIANRAPPSLLLGHLSTVVADSTMAGPEGSGAFDASEIFDTVSLAQGPSKVALGNIIGLDGKPHVRIFTVTFDTKHIFSYDPELRIVDGVIETGPGPHAIAVDTCTDDCAPGESPHSFLYVGHFTDSYLGVVDLDARHPETFGIMFASIGTPTAPRESK